MENAAIEGAAGGVKQRLMWWEAIWMHVTASWQTTLFGLGYGESLVALAQDPYIDPNVREPHNSIISAFGRTGLVGVSAYVAMHVSLTFIAIRTWAHYRREGHDEAAKFLYLLGAMFVVFWLASVGEDAFEKPFLAIPYYFFYGVILNMFARAEGAQHTADAIARQRSGTLVTARG
jgi:O-antigen ligase